MPQGDATISQNVVFIEGIGLNFMDDDVAKERAFMGNWVREIKWDWDGNLHAKRDRERCRVWLLQ